VVPHKAVQLASHEEEGRKCPLELGENYQKERQAVPHACPVCLQRKEVGTHREEVCATCQVELEESLQKEEATPLPLACHVYVSQKRKEVVSHTPSALGTCPVEVEESHQNQEGSPVPPA